MDSVSKDDAAPGGSWSGDVEAVDAYDYTTANRFPLAALDYAERGWPVLPLHSPHNGACSCGRRSCNSVGKHPRTSHGLKDATTDEKVIRNWWSRWPNANIGVVSGAVSGLVVLDIDPRNGGDVALGDFERVHGPLPQTVAAITGGGGRHVLFKHPGFPIKSRNIAPGVDVKADGGYIVVQPSVHASGRPYAWESSQDPKETELAPLPSWLLQYVPPGQPSVDKVSGDGQAVKAEDLISEGRRNATLMRLGGAMRRQGMSEREIKKALQLVNRERCVPPLGDAEVAGIARSVCRYQPQGRAGQANGLQAKLLQKPIAWCPFPVEVLPEPLKSFITESAIALGCDQSYIAVPLLSALAAAIGNTRRIRLKRGWTEPSVIWSAIVGDSGTLKSPALELALRPMVRLQAEALKRNEEAMRLYAIERKKYDAALAEWKRKHHREGVEPPAEPEPPVPDRFLVSDTTVEALAERLHKAPRGLLLVRDELSGWLRSFNQYRSRGSDAANYLEMHRAGQLIIDRKSSIHKTLRIPRAAVSITGSIQPETLRYALGREHFENGLAARLLPTMPPRRLKRWTEKEIDGGLEDRVDAIFDGLLALEFNRNAGGDVIPVDLPLSPSGHQAWVEFFNEHAQQQNELAGGDLASAWSKLEGYAARFALIFHLVRWKAGDRTLEDPDAVDRVSVEAGAALVRWFRNETRRVYQALEEDADVADLRRLVEWIRERGGVVSPREVQRSSRAYETADDAREALNGLVKAGVGVWEHPVPGPEGGKPTSRFRLADPAGVDNTPTGATERGGIVNVDTIDNPGVPGADRG